MAESKYRHYTIYAIIILISLAIIAKLYLVQIVYGEVFKDKADRQYVSHASTMFDRGTIYFEDKDKNLVAAATLKSGFTLALSPKNLTSDINYVYDEINKLYPIDKDSFIAKASLKNDPYEELAKRVPEDIGTKIAALKIPGVVLEKERWRYYPGNTIASQSLGFVGFKGDVLTGRYGVEQYYNDILTKNDGDAYANFFAQIFSSVKKSLQSSSINGSGDLVLTLEPSTQGFFENELKKVKDQYHAEAIGGIIMNPQNGEIYAMAANPTFDPNDYAKEKDASVFGNPLVSNVYEMGSIIKPLTMASGLDAGVVTPTTTYNDTGKITLDGKTISNFDGKARGVVPMQEVLSQSLNVGASHVESLLGKERFSEYMKNFGLGEETGIDLPGEAAGLLKNLESKRDVEYATASFGQGIAMTPVETIRALATLGNGGVLVTPHVVKQIRYNVGVNRDLSYDDPKQVLKKETSDTITGMLVKVVDDALLHGKIKMEHYSMAAKTGTAQIADPQSGGYYKDRYLHSFFGYFPAYNPQFIVFMYIYYPKGVQYASETLAMPYSDIAKFLINYYQVPPDR